MNLRHAIIEDTKSLAESETNVCGFRLYVEHGNSAAPATYRWLGMVEIAYKLYKEFKLDIRCRNN